MKTTFLSTTLSCCLLTANLLTTQAKAESEPGNNIAPDEKTQRTNDPEIWLTPLHSQKLPFKQGTPTEHISRVILYGTMPNLPKDNNNIRTLYLVLRMELMQFEKDVPHIVAIFEGFPEKETTDLSLADLDKDGTPEVIVDHEAGTGANHMRIFRFVKNPQFSKETGYLPIGAVLLQAGDLVSSHGKIEIENDGSVIVHDYTDEGREKAITKKYRLVDGVMKEVEK